MPAPNTTDEAVERIVLPCASEPLVSILIPTTSQALLLARCLKSLACHISAAIHYEVIIVLNAATDEVKALVQEQTSGVIIAESPANLGVAGGYNRARSLARGKYLMLLHDDTEIEPLWLESLIETAEANPAAGAIASMVLSPNGELQSAGCIIWREALTSQGWRPLNANPNTFSQTRPIDYSGTCSLLVRADTWDAIGGLDERHYPAYYVDVDLCMAIRKHGQIILFNPESRLIHHRGASSVLPYRHFILGRNRALFSAKWLAKLQDYEPYSPQDPTAFDRAMAHTGRVAQQLKTQWPPSSLSSPPRRPFDTSLQDSLHLEMERHLKDSYIAHLESRCESLEVEHSQISSFLQDCRDDLIARQELVRQKNEECLTIKKKLIDYKERCSMIKAKLSELKARLKEIEQSRWWRWRIRLYKMIGRR